MTSVDRVSLGGQTKRKANSPPGSKPRSKLILHMSDGTKQESGGNSCWGNPWWATKKLAPTMPCAARGEPVPGETGTWFHLGGKNNGVPTIYALFWNVPKKKWGWKSKGVDQSTAWPLYEHRGQ